MRVTIELPDSFADRVEAESGRLTELVIRALRPKPVDISLLRQEVLSFPARGPEASEIAEFRPSESATEKVRHRLRRSKEGALTPAEEAETDEIEEVDNVVSLLKAEVRKHLRNAA